MPLPGAARLSRAIVVISGLLALLIAGSNLLVWTVPFFQYFARLPGAFVMRANTALGISMAACSLLVWFWAGREGGLGKRRFLASLLGAVPAAIGIVTSYEWITGTDLAFDNFWAMSTFPGDLANQFTASPGRMSLNAALSMAIVGLALAGLDWTVSIGRLRRVFTAPILAVTAALPSCFGLVGYLSGSGNFTGLLKSTNVLLHTATALLVLSFGVMAIRADRQPVRRILSQGAGGILLRWLLPGATLSLIFLAWLINQARVLGFVASGEGTALMLFGGLILLFALIVSASRAIDVQERRAQVARLALHDEELRSRSILETSLDGVLIMNVEGRVLDWNLASEKIFGWSREEMLYQPLADHIIPERLRSMHNQGLKNYLLTGKGPVLGQRVELTALRRDGTEFPVELSINAVTDVEPPLFVGFIRDITERQRASQALREAKDQAEKASQAKDDFLAALSHELRTPLTPILLTASTLHEDPRLPDDVRSMLAMIERQVSLEARLIDDLLDLTRIAKGKLHLRPEMCDLAALLRHTVEIVADEAAAKQIVLHQNFEAKAHTLMGDSARLQQVFWNLLKNAVKFTATGGNIILRTRAHGTSGPLQIQVVDDGLGFEPDRAEQLFMPFEQEKPGYQHQFGGLGLGLAIARSIVGLHGGEIRAESPGPGQGACFTVTLPIAALSVEPPAPSESQPGALPVISRIHTILLVEDHEHTRQVLARLLQRAGHRVVTAASVEEAVSLAQSSSPGPDVLVSDLGLPDGSGIEILSRLREGGIQIPGIALSGYGMEDDVSRTREAGFSCHLVKPVKFDQLTAALSSLSFSSENA